MPHTSALEARIGPNAVTQLLAALNGAGLGSIAAPVFGTAAADDWLAALPAVMVEEQRVARLHRALRAALPPEQAAEVMRDAGSRTADYLLAARIPRPVQRMLKTLPAVAAGAILSSAIRRHAWTFAGSGRFTVRSWLPVTFEIAGNPLCRGEHAAGPLCIWHAAVFQRLFQELVSPRLLVSETVCEAAGAACCRFIVHHWRFTGQL